MSRKDLKWFALLCKKHGVAIELNHFPEKELKYLLVYGKKYGAEFSLGSDFHGYGMRDKIELLRHSQEMYELAKKYGLSLIDPYKFIKK